MNSENTAKLWETFPLLYSGRQLSTRESLIPFGFSCGDGWFDLIWELSEKLERLIEKFIEEHPDSCECEHSRAEHTEGKCVVILSLAGKYGFEDDVPCKCSKFQVWHPKATQVKEKFGSMRYYLSATDQMYELAREAEAKSATICEECGKPGSLRGIGWYNTLCDEHAVDKSGKEIPVTPDDAWDH